jgi:hypothetical protein
MISFFNVSTWHGKRKALEDHLFQFCVHFINKGCLWLFRIWESSNHHYFMMCSCNSKRNLFWVFHPSPYTTCFVLLMMGLGPRLFNFSSQGSPLCVMGSRVLSSLSFRFSGEEDDGIVVVFEVAPNPILSPSCVNARIGSIKARVRPIVAGASACGHCGHANFVSSFGRSPFLPCSRIWVAHPSGSSKGELSMHLYRSSCFGYMYEAGKYFVLVWDLFFRG